MNILIINIIALSTIGFLCCMALLSSIIYLIIKKRHITEKYQQLLNKARIELHEVREDLKKELVNVDLHREELISQTEHLQELNFELERLSLVASKTDNAVIIADGEGKFIWVNEGFEKLLGYRLTEFKKSVGENIYTVSTDMSIRPMIDRALRNKVSLHYTSRILTKNGETRWVKTTLNPIFGELNKIKQFVILLTDVSELKTINDNLKKLSLVASKTGNSVMILTHDEKIDWVNEAFVKMYGLNKDAYTSKYGLTLKDYCKTNNIDDLYTTIIDKKESITVSCNMVTENLTNMWKQVNITPVFSEKKELLNYVVVESDITLIKEAEQRIQIEKEKADILLLNILPEETAEELKSKGKATPRFYRSASVLFADIQDFTKSAENLTPEELVNDLQTYFSKFDIAASSFFVEKIKTMGDAYLCVGGIPMRNKSHPFDTVLVGLELQRIIKEIGHQRELKGLKAWQLRVGIHSGPIVAGVIGSQKMTYDIWGDTVNIAKRIESACLTGMVNISGPTYESIKDYFDCEYRGKVLAKHKGHIDMYFVKRLKAEFSENNEGIIPNKHFHEMLARL